MVAGFAGVTEVAALRWIPVAAGAGVLVAYDDRVVALDGPTGAERWHHRWVGADVLDLAATPMAASPWPGVRARGSRPPSAVFAFDADTDKQPSTVVGLT